MGTQQAVRLISVVAAGVLAARRFVAFNSSGEVDYSSAQKKVSGITQEAADAQGKVIGIAVPDGAICKVEAGGVIAVGQGIATDVDGKVIALVLTPGNKSFGWALDAGVDGSIIRIQFHYSGAVPA